MSIELMSVGVHVGRQLERNAEFYPRIIDCVAELLQNSIDKAVRGGRIVADINYRTRTITVQDNGGGVSPTQFREKLDNVCVSSKGDGDYGQFGLGFFSPISKCDTFTLISQPRHDSTIPYMEYLFNVPEIIKSATVKIPSKQVSELIHEEQLIGAAPESVREKTSVWWKTEVHMTKVTTDKAVCRFDISTFCQSISEKYGEKIREKKLDVTVKFTPEKGAQTVQKVNVPEFTGTKLDEWRKAIGPVGQVVVNVFLAIRTPSKGRQGKIGFGQLNNPYNLTAIDFVGCAERHLGHELSEVLKSGIFEGRIVGEKLKLHADRTRFHDDEALEAFSIALLMWYKTVGKKFVEEQRENDRDTRVQSLGLQAMIFAETLFSRPEYEEIFKGIKIGTVGQGHTEIPGAKQDPLGKAISTSAVNTESGEGGESGGLGVRGKENGGHVSAIVYGGGGRRRSIVKGSSTGLRFCTSEFDNIYVPFKFEMKTGTIYINTRHPDWAKCEPSDKSLVEYHRLVTQTTLDLHRFVGRPQSEFLVLQEFAFANLSTQVYGLLNAATIMSTKKK